MLRKACRNLIDCQPSRSVAGAALVITLAGLASRLLGMLRDRFLAGTFGAGDTLDAYYAAFRIPDLIYNLLILGALSAAFIPVFSGLIGREKKEEAWKAASGVFQLAILSILACSVVLAIFAPFLMKILTPGFSSEKMDLAVSFTRIMFLSPLFLGISGIFGGILTSFKKFITYSLGPIFYNLGIIIGVVFLVKIMGPVGLAWGVVLGAFLHMLVQWPAIKNLGFRAVGSIREAIRNKHVRRIGKLMIPRTLGIAITQINLLVMTIFASTLASGSLAVFSFAQNLQSVPLGLFGISFAIAVFPALSCHFAKEEKKEFIESFSQTFRQIMFFVIPLSVFMLVLRAQLVRIVLGSGKFDWEDTILTFEVLGIFVLSLFAQSLIPLLARSFYAMQDTKTPFYVGLFTEAINIILILFLISKYQILGLAMAFSIASVIQMFFLLFLLRLRFQGLDDKNILSSVGKIALASLIAGIFIQGAKYVVAFWIELDTFMSVLIQLSVSAIVGALVFSGVSVLLKLPEFFSFKESLMKRIWRSKKSIMEDTGEVGGM
ncbi:MAG: murein biosynthesis integral membrane protein MurJ [Patescibacteria group bacterium]